MRLLAARVGGFGYQEVGTSFVEYQGRGFWSWDGYLEHVLFLFAEVRCYVSTRLPMRSLFSASLLAPCILFEI